MEKTFPDRNVLTRYLLGELSDEDRSEIAKRYFEDDDSFDELLDVENELLDKYVRGSLTESAREAFKRYLERLPDAKQNLAVAAALIRFTDEDRERAQQVLDEHAPAPLSWGQSLLKSVLKQHQMGRSIMAASLVAIAIAFLFLMSQIRQARNDSGQLRAQISDLERENELLEQKARGSHPDASIERVRRLEEQLRLEQQANEEQAQRLASLQPRTPVVASWMLTPSLRSADSPDRVALPNSAKIVSINIPIESNEQLSTYRAIIQTTTGRQRLELAGLRASKPGRSVSLKLPADYFAETAYKLTVVGTDKDAAELARDYYFTVIRR